MNGQYWGIYQTQERSEAAYAETYLGGKSSEYDVVKNDNGFYTPIVATDGNLDAYKDLYDLTMLGFADNAVYLQAQGLNPDGTKNPTFPKLLDVDNLIDYELIDYFVRENDGPGGPTPNNVWGIYNRVNPDGFKWFQHDSEHTMFFGSDGVFDFTTKGAQWGFFNPTWLHEQLIINNQEYRMAFADRDHKHLFNQGALTPKANLARMKYRAEQIDQAI
ncbi:MAG: CotH kinase family protein, partial [Phycisphaerae bacterium]|nr:CotH kinase family protein [Phycisphaerae bacterium]